MEQETLAAQAIETVGTDALYDESVKRLLANKSILAVILKECVPEFKHCTTREIAEQYIEGEPQIGEVGIAPDETNRSGEVIHGLLKFLEVLLSDEKTAAAKKTILQNEFDVPMTQTLETEVYQMCNLSQGAIEKGIQKGYGQGREEERIASVRNLMQNLHMTAEDAMKVLNIPQEDRDRIKKALAN